MLLLEVFKVPTVSFLADWYHRRPLQPRSQDALEQNEERFDSKVSGTDVFSEAVNFSKLEITFGISRMPQVQSAVRWPR